MFFCCCLFFLKKNIFIFSISSISAFEAKHPGKPSIHAKQKYKIKSKIEHGDQLWRNTLYLSGSFTKKKITYW